MAEMALCRYTCPNCGTELEQEGFMIIETTDEEATRQGLLDGLGWLKKQMKPQDLAVIFYAGHGARDAKGRFFLLPLA